jgi:hypothetical protein
MSLSKICSIQHVSRWDIFDVTGRRAWREVCVWTYCVGLFLGFDRFFEVFEDGEFLPDADDGDDGGGDGEDDWEPDFAALGLGGLGGGELGDGGEDEALEAAEEADEVEGLVDEVGAALLAPLHSAAEQPLLALPLVQSDAVHGIVLRPHQAANLLERLPELLRWLKLASLQLLHYLQCLSCCVHRCPRKL